MRPRRDVAYWNRVAELIECWTDCLPARLKHQQRIGKVFEFWRPFGIKLRTHMSLKLQYNLARLLRMTGRRGAPKRRAVGVATGARFQMRFGGRGRMADLNCARV